MTVRRTSATVTTTTRRRRTKMAIISFRSTLRSSDRGSTQPDARRRGSGRVASNGSKVIDFSEVNLPLGALLQDVLQLLLNKLSSEAPLEANSCGVAEVTYALWTCERLLN